MDSPNSPVSPTRTPEAPDESLLESLPPLLWAEAERRDILPGSEEDLHHAEPGIDTRFHLSTSTLVPSKQLPYQDFQHTKRNVRSSSSILQADRITWQLCWQVVRVKFGSTWAWEIGGIFISISCMIAVLSTLPYLSDHPLSDWKFPLGPNTMISTSITVTKTSMLLVIAEGISQLKWSYFQDRRHPIAELQDFDEASRGPWGSTMFLFSAKKHALVASLGALIMVAALAMDPFGQQIVSFETRYIPQNGSNGTIPVAYSYSPANLYCKFDSPRNMARYGSMSTNSLPMCKGNLLIRTERFKVPL